MKLILDTHTHTIASGHAFSTIREYVNQAKIKGITHFATTDHGPAMPGSASHLYFYNIGAIPKYIDGVRVYRGIELNILDHRGGHDLPPSLLPLLDVVIAGLHTPCLDPGTRDENTKAAIEIMKNPYIKILAHPGDANYPIHVDKVLQAAMETGTYLEVNNKSLQPGNYRNDRDAVKEVVLACKAANYPITLGSDAHIDMALGSFNHILELLAEVDFPEHLVLNTNIERFEKALGLEPAIDETNN